VLEENMATKERNKVLRQCNNASYIPFKKRKKHSIDGGGGGGYHHIQTLFPMKNQMWPMPRLNETDSARNEEELIF
jgi:hypothetical protein